MDTTNSSLKELQPQYNKLKYKYYFFTFLIFIPIIATLLFLKITDVSESVETFIQIALLVFTLLAFSILTFKNMRKDSAFRKINDQISTIEYTITRFGHIFYDFTNALSASSSKEDLIQFLHKHTEFKEAFEFCLKLLEEYSKKGNDEVSEVAKKILAQHTNLTEPQKAVLIKWSVEADVTIIHFLNITRYTVEYIDDQIEVLTNTLEFWGENSNMGEAVRSIILQLAGDEEILAKYVDPF